MKRGRSVRVSVSGCHRGLAPRGPYIFSPSKGPPSNFIRTIFDILDWGVERTPNFADDVFFKLKNSFLYHTRNS